MEANEFLRLGLKLSLDNEADIEVVGHCDSGVDALAQVAEHKPHVILLSVDLPDMSGLQACQQILRAAPETRIVMVTPSLADDLIVGAMMSGAAGVLPKNSPPHDLICSIRANGNGGLFHAASVAERVLNLLRGSEATGASDRLTHREKQILIMVARGMGNRDIGATLAISKHTVRNHISRIFAKLDLSGRAQLGAYAVRMGLLDD